MGRRQGLLLLSPWSSKAWVSSCPITTPIPPKLRALWGRRKEVSECRRGAAGQPLQLMSAPSRELPLSSISGSLGVVAGVERCLQDASGEDDAVLGGQVVGIDGLWGHAPPGEWGTGMCLPPPSPPSGPSCAISLLGSHLQGAGTRPMTKGPCVHPGEKPGYPQLSVPPHLLKCSNPCSHPGGATCGEGMPK